VSGPVFVSIGDSAKLTQFLELNSKLNKNSCFVDNTPTFDAYEAAGFTALESLARPEGAPELNIKKPNFPFGDWIKYFANIMKLSTLQDGEKLSFKSLPKSTLRVGGTFVIEDENILYAWADSAPGDHPEIEDVLQAAGVMAKDSFV